MKILVILGHPDKKSFCHAIAGSVVNALLGSRHEVFFHDLYREEFPPLLPAGEIPMDAELPPVIAGHCAELSDAEGIIIIHPNWWGQPPAVLKGYVDRIFRPGAAYEFLEGDSGEGIPNGLLNAKTAIVFNTSNTSAERETAVFGDPLETLWKNCIFGLCGVGSFYRKTFRTIVTSTPEQRQAWLKEAGDITKQYFP